MDLGLHGRTAVVTGASGGIGRAIAAALAAEGVRVAVVARRAERLEELASELEAMGAPAPVLIVQDLVAADAPQAIATQATAGLGRVDILVNNAGGHWPATSAAGSDVWEQAFTLNFFRHRELTQLLIEGMCAEGWGRIVNITGKSEPSKVSGVSCAKAAMHAWSKGLSREIGSAGVTINCIAPGRIMTEQMLRDYTPEERADHVRQIPIGEYGSPADLAPLACFLCSQPARYITGTVTAVDGGLRRYQF